MSLPAERTAPEPIRHVLEQACQLAAVLPGVVGIGLAGSWTRGAARQDSDVDLVVLTNDVGTALGSSAWFAVFGPGVELIRAEDFGAIRERRLRLADGVIVEVGIGVPSWANTDPVDAGTRQVVRDGFIALHDPHGVLAALLDAVAHG